MKKLILITLALLVAAACADARFASFQTYSTPQISYNIISDGGATCNGDVQSSTVTASITSGTKNFAVTANTFSSGDVGKQINIAGAGGSGGTLSTTITAFVDAQHVTLNTNASTTLSGASSLIYWGSDDRPAFDTFNNWARANQGSTYQVVLNVPNGSNCWFGSGTFNYINIFNAFAAGINNLIVEGTGATLNTVGGFSFQLGGIGICSTGLTDASGCSARIQTVSAGSNTVTLTAASLAAGYISRFPVGQWIMVGGLDIQGLFQAPFGYPPNSNYFEWRQVLSANAGTGVITLDRSLSNSYQSNWAQYNQGSAFQSDAGGPATIWAVGGSNNTWNSTVEYRGMTISQAGQTYSNARYVTYRNITFANSQSAIPSQNETWSAYNSTFAFVNMETDKLVGTMLMDGVTIPQIVFQSSSTDNFILRNSNITTRLDGGAKTTTITDSTLNNWGPGLFAYGVNNGAQTCTRCTITTLNTEYSGNHTLFYTPFPYSMAGGLITVPNTTTAGQSNFVPGTRFLYSATGFFTIGAASVTAVTGDSWPAADNQTATTNVSITSGTKNLAVSTSIFSSGDVGKVIIIPGASGSSTNLNTWITAFTDAQHVTIFNNATATLSASSRTLQWGTSNTYAQTTAAGGFPNISSLTSDSLKLAVFGTNNFTCDTCSGDANAVGMSVQAGATPNTPLASYIKRTFTPTSAQGNLATIPTYGRIVSVTIDVTDAYTGVGAAALNVTGQFHLFTVKQSNYTQYDWVPTINLKQVGRRVITPSGTTCDGVAGACSGDFCTQPASGCYSLPEAVWIGQNIIPFMGSTLTGDTATFTITVQTDQSP